MSCFLIREPTVTVIYIFVLADAKYRRLAMRFARVYAERQAGYPHRLVIVCNGGTAADESPQKVFEGIAAKEFFRHNNLGWDIGAYQAVAAKDKSDLLVFIGASCFPTRAGWLRRIVESYELHGDALYGAMHHHGDPAHGVSQHIRTTGFWMPRTLFNAYPVKKIESHSQRYQFEHGKNCLTVWTIKRGYPVYTVTWENEWDHVHWRQVVNGYHQGRQAGLIFRDRLTEPPFWRDK